MRRKYFYNRGFTIVELLVVIAIIGILAAMVLVNVNSSRQKGRDTKRVSDIRQISTAMQIYFNDNGGFPGPGSASASGPTPTDGNPAWNTYILTWPTAPTPPDNPSGSSVCDATTNPYTYTQLGGGTDYNVTFCLGSKVGSYNAGVHTLSSNGIQ